MILFLDVVISVFGLIFFIGAGIVLLAAIKLGDVPMPYRELFRATNGEFVMAAVVAFFLAAVFLLITLYIVCLMIKTRCFATRLLQTKSFQEIIVIFRYREKSRSKRRDEESGVEKSAATSATPSAVPVGAEGEADEVAPSIEPPAMELNPIKTGKLPDWKPPEGEEEEIIGLGTDQNGKWSFHGHLRKRLVS